MGGTLDVTLWWKPRCLKNLLKRVIEAGKDADNKNLNQLFQPIFVQSHFKISAFLTPLTFLVAMNKKNNVQLL